MSKLIYITNTSLDGYVEDETVRSIGSPDQVHGFITELLRPIGTHLYRWRLYETMAYWDASVEGYGGGESGYRTEVGGAAVLETVQAEQRCAADSHAGQPGTSLGRRKPIELID